MFCFFFSVVVRIIFSTWRLRFSWVRVFFSLRKSTFLQVNQIQSINRSSVICLAQNNIQRHLKAFWQNPAGTLRTAGGHSVHEKLPCRTRPMADPDCRGRLSALTSWGWEGYRDQNATYTDHSSAHIISLYTNYVFLDCSRHWPRPPSPTHTTTFPRRSAASSFSISDYFFCLYRLVWLFFNIVHLSHLHNDYYNI